MKLKYIYILFPLSFFPILLFGQQNTPEEFLTNNSDSTHSIFFWNITAPTGKIIPIRPDTFLTDYFNRTNIEGKGISIAYLGNWGSPAQSRMFFERKDVSQFFFQDTYSIYHKSPNSFNFINTKTPYSNISYQRAGSHQVMEERLQSLLTFNIGKKFNIGFDIDYLYARGFYQYQSAKYTDWVFFGNYLAGHHQIHYFINPINHIHAENGGIKDNNYISHPNLPDYSGIQTTRDIPTRLNTTWNKLKGNQIYFNYHYNFGLEKTISDENENPKKQFIPISNIIYTLDYQDNKKNFYTTDSTSVADFYTNKTDTFKDKTGGVNDSTSYYSVSNTVGFSIKEGISKWIKFDLTVFFTQDFRCFNTMDIIDTINNIVQQTATYIGGELTKQNGKFLRYNTQGKMGIGGYNRKDFNISANIETDIPFGRNTVSLTINTYIKNLSPTYYENHYLSRYFQWDNKFNKIKKTYIGNIINIPHVETQFQLQFESITNYIYFDQEGCPQQHKDNIQIIAANLTQNFKVNTFHFDNQIVYQISTNSTIIPLPRYALYSSAYFQFKIANTLTIQAGTNVHFWTKYYAPFYEPAIQQFKLQDEQKVGNYPLINGFFNCHLKQTRFFIEYYNMGAKFISPSNYFSLPDYPVNPPLIKLGISINFIN